MLFLILLVVFLIVLKSQGRVGPFVWDPAPCGPPHHPGEPGSARDAAWQPRRDPESVLAERLANGDISPEEYLERLSLLQEK